MRCILSALCIVFTLKGMVRMLMMIVSKTIDQPQAPDHLETKVWIAYNPRNRPLPIQPQKPNSRIGSSDTLPSAPWTVLSTLIALGPTKMRVRVKPLVSPSAAPRNGSGMGLVGGDPEPKPT